MLLGASNMTGNVGREHLARMCEALVTGTDEVADQALTVAARYIRGDFGLGDSVDRAVAFLDSAASSTLSASREVLRDAISAMLDAEPSSE